MYKCMKLTECLNKTIVTVACKEANGWVQTAYKRGEEKLDLFLVTLLPFRLGNGLLGSQLGSMKYVCVCINQQINSSGLLIAYCFIYWLKYCNTKINK